MGKKIQVGYGTGLQGSSKTNLYGGKQSGKVKMNGGFNGCINVNFVSIDEDKWDAAFPNSYKPSWMKEDNVEKKD
jgi:hypothetical protein